MLIEILKTKSLRVKYLLFNGPLRKIYYGEEIIAKHITAKKFHTTRTEFYVPLADFTIKKNTTI